MHFIKVAMIGIAPIAITMVSVGFWLGTNIFLVRRKKEVFRLDNTIKLTFFVVVYIFQPQLITAAVSLFHCLPTPSGHPPALASDPSVLCWTRLHITLALSLGIPIFALWILAFNLHVCRQVRQQKSRLSENEMLQMYGLFYVGLREEAAPYWEVIISTLRKVVFIGIGTFIGDTSNEFKVSELFCLII